MITREDTFVPYQPSFLLELINYAEAKPRQYNIRMLYYQFDMPEQDATVAIVPDGCIDIMFFCTAAGTQAVVYGSSMKRKWFRLQAGCRCLGVRLPTEDFVTRIGCPAYDFTDRDIPLLDLVPGLQSQIEELDCHATGDDLNRVVSNLFPPVSPLTQQSLLVRYVLDYIHNRRGHVDLGTLADETGYSIRYIDKLFQTYVGLNPKLLCRIVRFHRLLECIFTKPDSKLVELAGMLNYYDQSHLNREFQHFYYLSPQKLLRRIGEKINA